MANESFGFDADSVKRIGNVVRRVERQSQSKTFQRQRWPVGGDSGGIYAKSVGSISARSGNTLGSGHVAYFTSDGSALTADPDNANVAVVNPSSVSIATGIYGFVLSIGGDKAFIPLDCNP